MMIPSHHHPPRGLCRSQPRFIEVGGTSPSCFCLGPGGTLLALLFFFDLASLVSRLQMCACVATHVGMHLAVQFVFALVRLVSRLRMCTCVATHVALHAKRAVAPVKGAFKRCGVAALATEVMMADTVQMN